MKKKLTLHYSPLLCLFKKNAHPSRVTPRLIPPHNLTKHQRSHGGFSQQCILKQVPLVGSKILLIFHLSSQGQAKLRVHRFTPDFYPLLDCNLSKKARFQVRLSFFSGTSSCQKPILFKFNKFLPRCTSKVILLDTSAVSPTRIASYGTCRRVPGAV